MKTGIGKYIGLATLVGISLTCDSNNNKVSSIIENKKLDIENIFTIPVGSNILKSGIRKNLGDTASKNTADILIQGEPLYKNDITTKDSIDTDSIQIYANNNITDTTERGTNNNTIIGIIPSKENIKKILSTKECKDMCDEQISKSIVEIIPSDAKKIKFDVSYMRRQAYNLFQHFFNIEDTEDGTHLVFSKIQQDDKIFVTHHMDNMKHHIKEKNNFWIKLLLTKGDLKNYIINGSEEQKEGEKSNIQKLYEIITNTGSIKYQGDESQFQKDIESVINLY